MLSLRLPLGTALCTLAIAAAAAPERAPPRQPAATDADSVRLVVRYKPTAARERALAVDRGVREPALRTARRMSERSGLALADGPSVDAYTQVLLARGADAQALADRLAVDGDVEWVGVDRRQRVASVNDPLYPDGQTGTPAVGQWFLRAPTASQPAAVDAEGAWAVTQGSASIVVAVVDTGVRRDHPDLAGKLLPGYDFVSDVPTANDGDGRDDDPSDPGDWITAAEDASGTFRDCGIGDSSWHGTQVAGLVGAATDNGLGVAGVGWNLRVLPVRALGKCGGYVSDIVSAMRWAAGLDVPGAPPNPYPARVLNLSLGSANPCDPLYQAAIDELAARGVVVVTAAGNDGVAVNQPGNCRGVLTVAGVRHAGTKVGYSNLGPQVTIAAPAGNCVNTFGSCLYPLPTTSNSGLRRPAAHTYTGGGADATIGTSFASPLVAASVGLLLSVNPTLHWAAAAERLAGGARAFRRAADATVAACRVPTGFDDTPQLDECNCTRQTCGAGLLDAGRSVAAAVGSTAPPPAVMIVASTSDAHSGDVVTLSRGASAVAAGRSFAVHDWRIVGGSAPARFSGATDGASARLVADGAGNVVVQLTITDSAGLRGSTTSELTFTASSGGGASGPGWIVALVLATAALARAGRRGT